MKENTKHPEWPKRPTGPLTLTFHPLNVLDYARRWCAKMQEHKNVSENEKLIAKDVLTLVETAVSGLNQVQEEKK